MANRPTLVAKLLTLAIVGLMQTLAAAEPVKMRAFKGSVTIQAEDAVLDAVRAEVAEGESLKGQKGVALKVGLKSNAGTPSEEPDLVFGVKPPKPGVM